MFEVANRKGVWIPAIGSVEAVAADGTARGETYTGFRGSLEPLGVFLTVFLRLASSLEHGWQPPFSLGRMNLVGSHFQKYHDSENLVKILKWSCETSGGHIFVKKRISGLNFYHRL